MGMEILRVDALPQSAAEADLSFEINGVLIEPFDQTPLRICPVPTRRKAYGVDNTLFQAHDRACRGLFLAWAEDNVAGYICASQGWNGCATIDEFAVARSFRRRGLASDLMDRAVAWSADAGFRTVRLETQTNNIAACRFYQRYGFIVGGHDRLLYRELGGDNADEVALFWYFDIPRSHP